MNTDPHRKKSASDSLQEITDRSNNGVEQRQPKKKTKTFQKIPYTFTHLDQLDQMTYRDINAASLNDILSQIVVINYDCPSLTRRLVNYDKNNSALDISENKDTYIYPRPSSVKNLNAISSYRDIHGNFWQSFYGTIENIGDNMTRPDRYVSKNTTDVNKGDMILGLLRSSQEQRNIIIRYMRICDVYKQCINVLYSKGQYVKMIEVISEFMTKFISSLIFLAICEANQTHINHIYTSIKRWNKVKPTYITDISTENNMAYKYMCALTMMMNKSFSYHQIIVVTALYLDYVAKDNNVSDTKLVCSVFETASLGGWVKIVDVFRWMVDLNQYADHSVGTTFKILNKTRSDKFRWMLKMK